MMIQVYFKRVRSNIDMSKVGMRVLDLWESFDAEIDYSNYLIGNQEIKVDNCTMSGS